MVVVLLDWRIDQVSCRSIRVFPSAAALVAAGEVPTNPFSWDLG